ncbi:pentatricopeptide repeat-containing protein, partial [Trifolium medium]|nr:pentatricopeptide repeat-containing protein [Trifolium medium]
NLDGAKRVYKEMVLRGVKADAVTCNAMLNGLCKAGKVDDSFELWE